MLVNAFSVVIKAHPDAALVITGPDNESYGEQVKRWVLDKKTVGSRYFLLECSEIRINWLCFRMLMSSCFLVLGELWNCGYRILNLQNSGDYFR